MQMLPGSAIGSRRAEVITPSALLEHADVQPHGIRLGVQLILHSAKPTERWRTLPRGRHLWSWTMGNPGMRSVLAFIVGLLLAGASAAAQSANGHTPEELDRETIYRRAC
jgi:hypothetical protein